MVQAAWLKYPFCWPSEHLGEYGEGLSDHRANGAGNKATLVDERQVVIVAKEPLTLPDNIGRFFVEQGTLLTLSV